MKAHPLIKLFVFLPLILFIDYLIMPILGCTSCLFGMDENFFCGPFCIAGKIILLISLLIFSYLICPDIKKIFKSKANGTTPKETENM